MPTNQNGAILYQGPSRLNGEPIVVIATGLVHPSINRKTGPMVQTWILRSDTHPVEAVHSGDDSAICGDCPLRPLNARGTGGPMCYVRKETGPGAIYRAYQAGSYPRISARAIRQLATSPIRFGAYGDPGAAPLEIWRTLESKR